MFRFNLSPAILNSVLRHHLTQGEGHTSVNSLLSESLYVDDLVGAAGNDNEAFEIYHKAQLVIRLQGLISGSGKPSHPFLRLKLRINYVAKACMESWRFTIGALRVMNCLRHG